jgi:alpha-beta hydrolase superfamily lysophospholipase
MGRVIIYASGLVPAAMLVYAATGRRGWHLFVLLRWVVSIGAAILALAAHERDATGWFLAMLGLLVLFNPFVPVHLRRDLWRIVDLAAAVLFVVAAFWLAPGTAGSSGSSRQPPKPRE